MALDRLRDLERCIKTGPEAFDNWLTFTDPAVARIAAGSGFDFAALGAALDTALAVAPGR